MKGTHYKEATPEGTNPAGIDMGLNNFITLSDGKSQGERKEDCKVARRDRGSKAESKRNGTMLQINSTTSCKNMEKNHSTSNTERFIEQVYPNAFIRG
ncbi:MAG: hypothetical protein QXY52_02730 [Conexivisphaerales archaeon]